MTGLGSHVVLSVGVGRLSRFAWATWSIEIEDVDGVTPGLRQVHCTPWDVRDVVVSEPEEVS